MKIAIQGHPTRGKEVIQILKSLGGINRCLLLGNSVNSYYYIDYGCENAIYYHAKEYVNKYCKKYTLEEFEKEYPFKIGDKIITSYGDVGIIRTLTPDNDETPYCVETEKGYIYRHQSELKLYKEMKEERNITLTLDKAKEWYKKGGELKEVALQAYSEEELTKVELPKTWKEFCENYPVQREEYRLSEEDNIMQYAYSQNKTTRIWLPSEKSAEAHLAMIKLEQLRDCWRQGWKPEYSEYHKYGIRILKGELTIIVVTNIHSFLTFPTREMAEEFLKCFRDLIEKAGDLI